MRPTGSNRLAKSTLVADVAAKLPQPQPAADAEQVTQRRDGELLEARSTSRRIKTVEDLLAHIEADMTRYEVAASEATKWECASSDGKGGTTVTELHRVFVRLKPKAGPGVQECVAAMIAAASGKLRTKPLTKTVKARPSDLWQVQIVSDTHFGNYAWSKTTGHGDYDIGIAEQRVASTAMGLLDIGDEYRPALRTIAFLGDLFHYDTPQGTTTSGTQLERDGRLQKMIEVGSDTLLAVVARSAETCQTNVLFVNGNHDEVLTWAFQRIAAERFANHKNVTISRDWTPRQYAAYGRNLCGFAHGNRAKRKLPQLMALEAASQWSASAYREYHTGHYHSQAAEWSRPIETIDGVLVRVAPTVCPPDDWHSTNGFVGARQCMETFLYQADGGLVAQHVRGATDADDRTDRPDIGPRQRSTTKRSGSKARR